MPKTIQIISRRGIKYGDIEEAKPFFNALENICKDEFESNGLSATCGDLYGLFTLLIGVPDGISDRAINKIGERVATALFPSRYRIIDEPIDCMGKWIMTATGKEAIEVHP